MWNKILDATVFFSFDQSGFIRHSKNFKDDIIFSYPKKALITGGTSGIGLAVAEELSRSKIDTIIIGRNMTRAHEVIDGKLHLEFIQLDLSHWSALKESVKKMPPLDYVVLNAGGMPENFETNKQGVERQFASQLFGHYFLIKELHAQNKLNVGARIIWVTSGGMYLKALDLKTIFADEKYNKVTTYANVKRAQVTLLPLMAKEFSQQIVCAMHPGWADTPGVQVYLPRFYQIMKNRLRTPRQGADTILWLLSTKRPISSGGLYFDRQLVGPHMFSFTRSSDNKQEDLYEYLQKYFIELGDHQFKRDENNMKKNRMSFKLEARSLDF